MFIKQFQIQCQDIKTVLQKLSEANMKDSTDYLKAVRVRNAYKELNDYIINGDWTRKESRDKFVAWIKSKYDYELISKRFNTRRDSLDVFISRQDKRLNNIMGEALGLILQGRINEGLVSFYAKSGKLSAYEYDYRITDLLPKPEKKDSVYLKDCAQEIFLLQSLQRKEMIEWLSDADTDRLAHLMFLLNTDDPAYAKQKKELVRLILKK